MDYIYRIPSKDLGVIFDKTGDGKFLGQKTSLYYIPHFTALIVNHSALQKPTKMWPCIQL